MPENKPIPTDAELLKNVENKNLSAEDKSAAAGKLYDRAGDKVKASEEKMEESFAKFEKLSPDVQLPNQPSVDNKGQTDELLKQVREEITLDRKEDELNRKEDDAFNAKMEARLAELKKPIGAQQRKLQMTLPQRKKHPNKSVKKRRPGMLKWRRA